MCLSIFDTREYDQVWLHRAFKIILLYIAFVGKPFSSDVFVVLESRHDLLFFLNVVNGFETDPVFKYLQDTASQSCKSTKVCRHWRLSVLAMSTRCAGHVWIVDYSRDVSATIVMPKTECLRSAGAQAS